MTPFEWLCSMSTLSILNNMKASYLLFFLCGAAMMLGFSTLAGSNTPHHVYELRLYHVNEGKWMLSKLALAITPTRFSGGIT
jgi:hypothetical protein